MKQQWPKPLLFYFYKSVYHRPPYILMILLMTSGSDFSALERYGTPYLKAKRAFFEW